MRAIRDHQVCLLMSAMRSSLCEASTSSRPHLDYSLLPVTPCPQSKRIASSMPTTTWAAGGSFWVALPDVFQSDNLVVATTGYTYTAGIFILTIESSALSSVLATATVMDGYLLKVVVATPG